MYAGHEKYDGELRPEAFFSHFHLAFTVSANNFVRFKSTLRRVVPLSWVFGKREGHGRLDLLLSEDVAEKPAFESASHLSHQTSFFFHCFFQGIRRF